MCLGSYSCYVTQYFRLMKQCSFVEHRNYKIVYRRYASLFFLVGVDNEEVSFASAPFQRSALVYGKFYHDAKFHQYENDYSFKAWTVFSHSLWSVEYLVYITSFIAMIKVALNEYVGSQMVCFYCCGLDISSDCKMLKFGCLKFESSGLNRQSGMRKMKPEKKEALFGLRTCALDVSTPFS